jgi:hypothetical protein
MAFQWGTCDVYGFGVLQETDKDEVTDHQCFQDRRSQLQQPFSCVFETMSIDAFQGD